MVKKELSKYRQVQLLLDAPAPEQLPIVRESNSETVWRLWDEATQEFDRQFSVRSSRSDHCHSYSNGIDWI